MLRAEVPPEQREAWYERQLKNGLQVCICHPKLVQTGLDLLDFPTILFYETGYSTFVLRQASRRSWRIGQRHPVRVGFLSYAGTAQESCLKHMTYCYTSLGSIKRRVCDSSENGVPRGLVESPCARRGVPIAPVQSPTERT